MGRFISGVDRKQTALFLPCVDDWIGEDSPVRVINASVDALDLLGLGFEGVEVIKAMQHRLDANPNAMRI